MITSRTCSRYWELSDRFDVLKKVPAAERGPAFYEELGKVHYEHTCISRELNKFCDEWKYSSTAKISDNMKDSPESH